MTLHDPHAARAGRREVGAGSRRAARACVDGGAVACDRPATSRCSRSSRRGRASACARARRSPTRRPARRARTSSRDDDAHRVLFALTLGTSEPKHLRGLATDGRIALPMSGGEHSATLVASEDGQLTIAAAHELASVPAHTMPWSSRCSSTTARWSRSRLGTPTSRAALGLTPAGRVYVARTPAGGGARRWPTSLKRAGCTRAVLLDRGAGTHGSIFRAGTATPPRSRYEETTLYAMGKPLLPRGFRFESTHPVEPPPPKKK